jgi:hypothetical protein
MSQANSTFSLNSTREAIKLEPMSLLTLIFNIYTLSIIGACGAVLNLVCIFIFTFGEFKIDTYKYLILKSVSHMAILTCAGSSSVYICTSCPLSQTFGALMYRYVCITIVNTVSNTVASLIEILLSYDRLLMFGENKRRQQNWFIKTVNRLPFAASMITIILAIGVFVNIPIYLSFRVELNKQNKFVNSRTQFGNTQFSRYYAIALSILLSLISFVLLIILNVMVIKKFNIYIERKSKLVGPATTRPHLAVQAINKNEKATGQNMRLKIEAKCREDNMGSTNSQYNKGTKVNKNAAKNTKIDTELNFTKMIVVSSLCFTFTRFVSLLTVISMQLFPLFELSIYHPFITVITMATQLSNSSYFASNIFIYMAFNKLFRARFLKLFKIRSINN